MSWFANMKVRNKFNLIIAVVFATLLVTNAIDDYNRQQSLIIKDAVDNARILAKQIIQSRDYISSVVRGEPDNNYALVPQVVATQIAKRITSDSKFYVRQVSLRYRNPANSPDPYETAQLRRFSSQGGGEKYEVVKIDGKQVFRYMLPMKAEPSCLGCHGTYDAAPAFVRARFPRGHFSYNYTVGEIIGAVSVSIPMVDLYRQIGTNLRLDLAFVSAVFFLIMLLMSFLVRRFIIGPIMSVSATISHVTRTGSFADRIPVTGNDEIGQLVIAFNDMMEELEHKTVQRRESEDRYRNVMEMAQSAMVTFMPDGKMVITNQKAEKLFGLPKDELLGESFFSFLENGQEMEEGIGNYLRDGRGGGVGERTSHTVRDVKGRTIKVEVALSASRADQATMFTAILRENNGKV